MAYTYIVKPWGSGWPSCERTSKLEDLLPFIQLYFDKSVAYVKDMENKFSRAFCMPFMMMVAELLPDRPVCGTTAGSGHESSTVLVFCQGSKCYYCHCQSPCKCNCMSVIMSRNGDESVSDLFFLFFNLGHCK